MIPTQNDMASRFMDDAIEAYKQKNLPTAILCAVEALNHSTEWPLRGHVLHALATMSVDAGSHRVASWYWTRFTEEAGRNNNAEKFPTLKLATGKYDAAHTYRLIGDHGSAIRNYREALATFRNEGKYLVQCLQDMAFACCSNTLNENNKYVEMAMKLLEESKHLCETDEDIWHQRISEAFALRCVGKRTEALSICNSLLSSSANNTVKAQACFVACHVSIDKCDKEQAELYAANMAEFIANSTRKAGLQLDHNQLQRLIGTID